ADGRRRHISGCGRGNVDRNCDAARALRGAACARRTRGRPGGGTRRQRQRACRRSAAGDRRRVALGTGPNGLFALRTRELEANAAARERADAMRKIGEDLRGDVNDLVVGAEANALRASASAHDSVETGRLLLLVIAGISIAVPILIVWLFVVRY